MNIKQQIGGPESEEVTRILPERTISIQMSPGNHAIRIHDGVTPGGIKFIPESQMAAWASKQFDSVVTHSVPGPITDVGNKFLDFTVAGDYTLPLLATLPVGTGLLISATVPDVVIKCAGAEQIINGAAVQASLALSQGHVTRLARKNSTRWVILNRYS